MNEKNEENEKMKRSFGKRGLVIGLSALLLTGGGITAFLLANRSDAKAMETGMEQVAVHTSTSNVTPTSANNVQENNTQIDNEVAKQEEQSKDLWVDKHKITVKSDNPTNVAITACDAAKIALKDIEKDTKQVDDDCEVELLHMNTAGTGESTGCWTGFTVLNDTKRYEFRINDATGEVIRRDEYIAGDDKFKWEKTGTSEKANDTIIIDDQKLATFSKIDASKINVADCEIVEGKNYGIYIKYNNTQQTVSYESKNGVLTVKVEQINKKQNRVNAHITITVPKKTKFESIVYTSSVGNFSMGEFVVNSLKLNPDCGGIKLKGTSCETADLKADCGNATFSGCSIKNTTLFADCGNVDFTDCTMTKTKISADCGNVDLKNSNVTDSTIKASCGNIEGVNLVSKNLNLTSKYGNVQVTGDFAGTNNFDASMGCVAVGCTKDKSQYSYTLSAESGNVMIDNVTIKNKDARTQNSSAANSIKASAEMGNCSVNFKVDPATLIEVPDVDSYDYDDGWDVYDDDDDEDDNWDDFDWDDFCNFF